MGLLEFIDRYYIEGIVNDTSYNHYDMFTYVVILFAGVYAVLKLLNRLKIKVDEELVIATIPYIFLGSVFRVIEDAELLNPPFKYLFITPLIFFVVFAITSAALLLSKHLEKTGKIKSYLNFYSSSGVLLSVAGIAVLIFAQGNPKLDILLYSLLPAIALTGAVQKLPHAIGMVYLRSRVYSFAVFSFLLDSLTTYIGVDLLGYENKHPFSSFLADIFGTGIVLVPLSLILVLLILMMLEKEYEKEKNNDEKFMLALTLIVLGFSMGARNLLAMVFF